MKLHRIILALLFFQLCIEANAQWSVKHLDETVNATWSNIVKFKNDSLGLFMGDNAVILKSIDAGETWNPIPINIKMNLSDFQFVGDSTVYAIGNSYPGSVEYGYSLFIKSIDNGDTWDSIASFSGKQLWSLFFLDEKTGIVAGYDGIFRTTDSGKSWDTIWSYSDLGYEFGEIKQICFPNTQVGFAVGIGYHHTGMPDRFLLKTIDSGMSWDTVCTFKNDLSSLYFVNADTGFVGTEPGIIYKTVNRGITWREQEITKFWNGISSIQFISDKIGFVVGHQRIITGGTGATSFFISKTIDGGDTWETFNSNGIPLNSIFFLNDSTGFVSGGYSLIMKTTGKIDELPADYPWHLVDDGMSVKEIDDSNSLIKAFPNPSSGILNIQLKNSAQPVETFRILSSSGQQVDVGKPKLNSENIQVDLSGLVSGMYFLQVSFSGKTELIKVLKK